MNVNPHVQTFLEQYSIKISWPQLGLLSFYMLSMVSLTPFTIFLLRITDTSGMEFLGEFVIIEQSGF